MHDAGYDGTELGDWEFMPTQPAALASELARRKLALIGGWVNVALHDKSKYASNESDAIRTARLLKEVGGDKAIVVLGNDPYTDPMRTNNAGRITEAHEMTLSQWSVFLENIHAVAKAVKKETGLRTVFHPHIGTVIETPSELQKFVERTDGALIGLVFDTGHCAFGGGNPLQQLQAYRDRIWHVHFKDFDAKVAEQAKAHNWDGVQAVEHGVFCELGKGSVDFAAILSELRSTKYDGWIVVEQDVLPSMGSPKESAQRNRTFLRSLNI